MFRKFWVQAHWFAGITAGVILAVVGATGAILSFEDEIQDWLNRDTRNVPLRKEAALPPADLLAAYQLRNPQARVTSLLLSGNPNGSVRVSVDRQNSYIDPYTGDALSGTGTRGREFFSTTRSLHRWLVADAWGSRDIGRQVVGAAVMLCSVLALSGLYLRWPRGRSRSWRMWLALNTALKGRAFLWSLHAVAGTWFLVIILFMSLTGPYWSYEWYRNGLYAIAGVERPAPRRNEAPRSNDQQQAPATNLTAAWHSFLDLPDTRGLRTATLNLPRDARSAIEIRYLGSDAAHSRATNTVVLNAASGAVERHERYDDKRAGEKFMASILPLHTGSFFGATGRILFMLGSLSLPLFAITGWMMYLQGRRGKQQPAS